MLWRPGRAAALGSPLLTLMSGSFKPSAEAAALFAAMSATPSAARQKVIDRFIRGTKADGNWTTIDVFQWYEAHDEQAALLNWKAPATFTATLEGTAPPSFAVDGGFTTDGVDNYIDTSFNASTAGGNMTQNSAMLGVWSLTNTTDTIRIAGQFDGTDGITIGPREATDRISIRVNQVAVDSSANGSVTSGAGWFSINRSAAGAHQTRVNGVQIDAGTVASVALNNLTIKVGTTDVSTFRASGFAGCLIGGSRSAAQDLQIYNRIVALRAGIAAT